MHKTQIIVCDSDDHIAFVDSRHIENLEGEPDCGQTALTTGTFRRPHVCSKVVNALLVPAKTQVLKKHGFLQKSENVFIR